MEDTMAVFFRNGRWPRSCIPCDNPGNNNTIAEAIQEFNRAVGYHILVDKIATDTAYISITLGGGNANVIGYTGNHARGISGDTRPVVIHEIMHVLGFLHEQYHRYYPWDDNHPLRPRAANFTDRNPMFSYGAAGGLAGSAWNQAFYNNLLAEYHYDFGVSNQLDCRHAAIGDARIVHSYSCDLYSVMMYSSSRAAYRPTIIALGAAAQPHNPPRIIDYEVRAPHASPNSLSLSDVQAIRRFYPRGRHECVKCRNVHGRMFSLKNRWHRCTVCNAIYCPTCGKNLPGKSGTLNPTRRCDRHGCNGRTTMVYGHG